MVSVKLYNAWFCPYAQRVWIGFLHKAIDFEYVEQDPYDKTEAWLAINPRGLVPAIVHNGTAIYESSICLEYLDEAWPGSGSPILPKDPMKRARARIWGDYIDKKLIAQYDALIHKSSPEDRQRSKSALLSAILELQDAMSAEGPFFDGPDFGYVDIVLYPHLYRLRTIMKRYRGFRIPAEEKFKRIEDWYAAVSVLDCVKKTMPDEVIFMERYQKYADNVQG